MIDIADCTLKMKLDSHPCSPSLDLLVVWTLFAALSQDTACHGLVVRVLPAYDGSGNLSDRRPRTDSYKAPDSHGDNDKVSHGLWQ